MIKKTIMVSLMLVFSLTNVVFASPLEDVMIDINSLESEVQKINYELSSVENEINSNKEKIMIVKKEIENNEIEVKKIESTISDKEKEISNNARLSYMNMKNPSKQCLEILLNSKSIKDFAQRLYAIKEVMSSSKEKLNYFNSSKEKLEIKQSEINIQQIKLEDEVKSLDAKLEELLNKKEDKEIKMLEYKELKSKYEKEIEENERMILESVQELESFYAECEDYYTEDIISDSHNLDSDVTYSEDKYGDNSSSVNVSSSSIVNIAFKYLGTPYVWGGTSPSGFDCSGFVQYVYREAGIGLSRTTYSQITEGYPVSEAKPGDLVFFGSYSAPYHVGIYIGNGQYIHAPMEGDVVKVAELKYRSDYCGARRYL